MGKKKDKKTNSPKPEKGKFPKPLLKVLENAGLSTENLIYCCTGDMDNEACYCSAWLSFDEKGLYIALGDEEIVKSKRKSQITEPK